MIHFVYIYIYQSIEYVYIYNTRIMSIDVAFLPTEIFVAPRRSLASLVDLPSEQHDLQRRSTTGTTQWPWYMGDGAHPFLFVFRKFINYSYRYR